MVGIFRVCILVSCLVSAVAAARQPIEARADRAALAVGRYGYVIDLPPDWNVNLQACSTVMNATSPDNTASIRQTVQAMSRTAAQTKWFEEASVATVGRLQGAIQYRGRRIHGANFQTATGVVRNRTKRQVYVLVATTYRSPLIYAFVGLVNNPSTTNGRIHVSQVEHVLGSIRLTARSSNPRIGCPRPTNTSTPTPSVPPTNTPTQSASPTPSSTSFLPLPLPTATARPTPSNTLST